MKSLIGTLLIVMGALGALFSTAAACGGDYFPHYVWGQGHVPIYVIDIDVKNPPPGGLMVKVAGKKEYISETREDQGDSSLQLMLPEGDYEITYSYVYEGYTYEKKEQKQVAISPASATCWQIDASKIPFPGDSIGIPGEKYLLPLNQAVQVEIIVAEWATPGSHWILAAAGNSIFAYSQGEGEWKPWVKATPPVKYVGDLAPTFDLGTFSMSQLGLPPGLVVYLGSGSGSSTATYPDKVTYFTIEVK
jgi:hypothetical protein